jgi:hypothetical protein
MYRAPRYYMARNTNPSIATEGWHPQQFFAIDPAELFHEYWAYRAVMLEHLEADAKCRATYQPQQVRRVFDLVHLKYLAPMLSPGVMDYLIRQSMLPDTTSQQIIEGIWNIHMPAQRQVSSSISLMHWHCCARATHPAPSSIFVASAASTPNLNIREGSMCR